MACLLPQFKCPQDTLPTHFKTHFKTRESRGQCIMSMTTHMVVDVESLQIPCLELHSNTITSPIGPSTSYIPHLEKSNFKATLAKEALLTGEEATIAAAASEAVALAKAAVEVAHDVALMMKSNPSTESHNIPTRIPSKTDILRLKRVHFPKMVQASIIGHLATATGPEWSSENFSILDFDEMEKSDAGCSFPMTQLSTSIDVRSRRQTERRARREKVTAKAAATFFSEKSGSTRRKKRITVQDVDNSDSLQFLRGTTITSKLLTANEELKLSEGIQDMLKLERLRKEVTERCAGQPTFAQWATAAGTDKKTLRKRLSYGMFCKDKMVKSNIRLVISIAKNYQGAGMNLQDLVQEGCRGLVKGSEKFDASKGFKFSTYAHWWIRQAVRKSLSDHSRTIRLPFHMVEATYRVREAKKQLYSETRRQPSNEEIAKAAGLSMKRLTAVLLIPKAPRSLDQKIGFMNLKPLEVTADPNAETGEDLQKKQSMKRDLDKVLNSLSQRENQVIRWRFGLEDGKMRTLQEIGELIGVSRERIRQIESCAFRKLKNKRRTKILQQYAIS